MRVCPILATALVAACATPPPASVAEPLDVLRRFGVRYTGTIDTTVEGGLLPEADMLASRPVDGTPQVWIAVRIIRMGSADARRMLAFDSGEPSDRGAASYGGVVARGAMHAAIDALVESGAGEEVAAPAFVVAEGHNAKTSLARQIALLSGFELATSDVRFVSDPVIEHVEVGFSIDVRPDALDADGAIDMEVDTRVVDMLGPPRRLSGNLDGASEIAVQVPLACHQRLVGSARFAVGEAIFLAGLLVPGTTDVLVVFVDARAGEFPRAVPDGGTAR